MNNQNLIRKNVQALHSYVPGTQPKNPSVVKLNTNENPYPPPPAVTEALSTLSDHDLRRYPDPMCTEVREALSDLHGLPADQIICGNGSDEILAYLLRAFVEPDETVGFFDPSYSLYSVLCDIHGLSWNAVPLTDSFSWPEWDHSGIKLFFITNPNAPTSLQFDRKTVEDFCDRFPGLVVLDEAYVDFAEWNGADLAASRPNVIVTRSLSKYSSLAGIRFGYAMGHKTLIDALYKIKDSYNLSILAQKAALAAIRDMPFIRSNTEKILATRTRITEELTQRRFQVADSKTNFLWVHPTPYQADDVFKHLNKAGILVRFFEGPRTREFIRITVGTDQNMDHMLEALDEYIKNKT